ncbi:MAG TPA: urease accessory protein UreD, partial [Roseiflexaceae bacterium]|nr:urease accessory protein UreD [Roseiflexaceae bacterium]
MSRAGGHEPTHTTEEWPSGSGRQHGRLNLDLAPVTGVTRPLLCQAHPPLQLSRVRYDIAQQPEMAHLTILHLGGILAGDRYDFQVTLAPKAAAQISGAAATQVYRMPAGDAQQQIHIRMAAGSRLRWLPGPLILGSGARFTQQIRIELADSARLAFLDVLVPGRLAHGELYRFAAYRHRLTVHDPHGRLL